MTKRQAQTQAQILEKYRKAMKLSLSDFAKVLKTSRQSYYLWRDGTEIKQETLTNWAIRERGQLVGEMAVELLKARKSPLSNMIFTVAVS